MTLTARHIQYIEDYQLTQRITPFRGLYETIYSSYVDIFKTYGYTDAVVKDYAFLCGLMYHELMSLRCKEAFKNIEVAEGDRIGNIENDGVV